MRTSPSSSNGYRRKEQHEKGSPVHTPHSSSPRALGSGDFGNTSRTLDLVLGVGRYCCSLLHLLIRMKNSLKPLTPEEIRAMFLTVSEQNDIRKASPEDWFSC